jgi:RNA polymerase sigma factor (TIGR02999 family)
MAALQERESFDEQFSLVYEELRRLAAGVLRSEQPGKVTPTTLVHEAWLKLAHYPQVAETSPLHFRRIAARAMRQVLVDMARKRHAARRRDENLLVTFDEFLPGKEPLLHPRDILALDQALDDLSRVSARQAALVEGRFFGGLEIGELAQMLEISESTVSREWRSARAWLGVEIRRSLAGNSSGAPAAASSPNPD